MPCALCILNFRLYYFTLCHRTKQFGKQMLPMLYSMYCTHDATCWISNVTLLSQAVFFFLPLIVEHTCTNYICAWFNTSLTLLHAQCLGCISACVLCKPLLERGPVMYVHWEVRGAADVWMSGKYKHWFKSAQVQHCCWTHLTHSNPDREEKLRSKNCGRRQGKMRNDFNRVGANV